VNPTIRSRVGAVLAAALLGTLVLSWFGSPTPAHAAPPPAVSTAIPTVHIPTPCDVPLIGKACDTAKDAGNAVGDTLSGPLKGIKSSVDALTSAVKTIGSFNPKDLPETWAKAALHGVVWLLGKIQDLAGAFSTPGYKAAWWGRQYAVTYGLALVVLPFMLLYVGARIGGRDGPVGGITLAREVIARLPWTVPAIVLAPALMIETQGLLADLAKSFGDAGTAHAGSAGEAFMREIANAPHGNGFFAALGGAFMALVLFVVAIIFGIPVLLELAFSNWGANFFGLLVPLAIVFAIYPPWRKVLAGLMTFLVGIWLIPFAVNFVFWSVWDGADNFTKGETFSTLLYVIVGLMMLAVVPAFAPVILMKLMPEYHGPMTGGGDYSSQSRQRNQSERHRDLQRQRNPESQQSSSESSSSSSTQSGQPGQSSSPGVEASKPVSTSKAPGGSSGGSVGAPAAGGAAPAGAGGGGAGGGGAAAGAGGGAGAGAAAGAAGGAAVGVAGMAAAAIAKKMKSETYRARNKWSRHQ